MVRQGRSCALAAAVEIAMSNELKISPSGLMDLSIAAEYLGVTVATLRWLRRMKKLPFLKLGGKLFVRQNEIDSYLEHIREGSTND